MFILQQNEEFVAMMTGFRVNGTSKAAKGSTFLPPNNIGELPKTVDWRTKGYVTPVKDQVNVATNALRRSSKHKVIWTLTSYG